MKARLLAVCVGIFSLGGCSDPAADSGGAGDASDASSTGTLVELTADEWHYRSGVTGAELKPGNWYIKLTLTLKNVASEKQIVANPGYFSLETDAAKVYLIDAATALLTNPCSATVGMKIGGETKCDLVFQAPIGENPTKLVFNETDVPGASASSVMPAESFPQCAALEARDATKDPVDCDQCAKTTCTELRLKLDSCTGCTINDITNNLPKACSMLDVQCATCKRDAAWLMECMAYSSRCQKYCT